MSAKGAGARAGDTVDTLAERGRTKGRTGLWATLGAGAVAAATAVGVMRWRQQRRTPRSRAARMWHAVTDRFSW